MLLSGRDNIVVIEPHPDDGFLGLFHTLRHFWHKVILITLTNGESNFYTEKISGQKAVERALETKSFLEKYKVYRHYSFDMGDGKIVPNQVRNMIENTLPWYIKDFDPIFFAPSRFDSHIDHRSVNAAIKFFDFKTAYYCIDDPPIEIYESFWKNYLSPWQGKIKLEEFREIYPSQYNELRHSRHKGFAKRFKYEMLSEHIGV